MFYLLAIYNVLILFAAKENYIEFSNALGIWIPGFFSGLVLMCYIYESQKS